MLCKVLARAIVQLKEGILELEEKRESRGREIMESRQYSDQDSTLMSANMLYKEEGRPIPSQAKFL